MRIRRVSRSKGDWGTRGLSCLAWGGLIRTDQLNMRRAHEDGSSWTITSVLKFGMDSSLAGFKTGCHLHSASTILAGQLWVPSLLRGVHNSTMKNWHEWLRNNPEIINCLRNNIKLWKINNFQSWLSSNRFIVILTGLNRFTCPVSVHINRYVSSQKNSYKNVLIFLEMPNEYYYADHSVKNS